MNYKLQVIFFVIFIAFLANKLIANNLLPLSILPEELQFEVVSTPNKEVFLIWSYKNIHQVKNFSVERSTDGINFISIGHISCVGDSLATKTYEFKDDNPVASTSYYRLVLINNSTIQFAQTSIKAISLVNDISLNFFPNPAQDMLQMRIDGELNERYEVQIFNAKGYLLNTQPIQSSEGIYTTYIDIKNLPAGLYIIKVVYSNYSVQTSMFIKQ